MRDVSELIAQYRSSLEASEPLAPPGEQSSYARHKHELERLCALLDGKAVSAEIAAVVASERRVFGRSFLSGEHGARVESAFHQLASTLEKLHPLASVCNNGA
ncbi:MAG: hypothetical protein OEW94_13560 [Betaproteobacteria bacterium]|nr:hypothetical protein [Betaproteobacteria bacterium]MDH5352236.1 hypothetical protein [Betaproteobacteria bacterium]